MKGFNFEKNLDHQSQAVDSTIAVFQNVPQELPADEADKQWQNPLFKYESDMQYARNITALHGINNIKEPTRKGSNIIDIMMETGTGKTYTYTKTLFELNRVYGIFKFIIVVPTLSIKAGTLNFLKSESSREHFKELYGKTVQLHVVESGKGSKSKKSPMPAAIESFVKAGVYEKDRIQVLLINAGMVNSDALQKSYDRGLHGGKYMVPFEGIAATRPVLIIDEPHKFSQGNKTWENIKKMGAQIILRYGATFPEGSYENLVYTLTAVDSFNRNLVKGITGHIADVSGAKNALVKFIDSDGTEARFELVEGGQHKTFSISKGESLSKAHPEMEGLLIEGLNKSTVRLSNGMELKKGDKLNPYSFAETLQVIMMRNAVREHFLLEKKLLTRPVRIKPLTLFFIDNIEEYRNADGYLRTTLETLVAAEATALLQTETHGEYRAYLEKTLANLAGTHGGYFSKDNTEKDEAIEKEISEILHDKESMLDLENPRRFIFSKWTLREGWDNPNVFGICKLRSSGSDISKLQEVGRGLRLPVNEFGNRVKEEEFFLNYFVDFTESDFITQLIGEINEKSGAFSIEAMPEKLTDEMLKKICEMYAISEDDLLAKLDEDSVINRSNAFKAGGFEYIKKNYIRIFEGVHSGKVRKAGADRKKITVRTEKYSELKVLWEKLNEKVILEYQFENEDVFEALFTAFLALPHRSFETDGIRNRTEQVRIEGGKATMFEYESVVYGKVPVTLATMKYSEFLKALSQVLSINLKTLHRSFKTARINMADYLNAATVRKIAQDFRQYLLHNAIDKFSIGYKKVSNRVHPTVLTNAKGEVVKEVSASDVGVLYSEEKVASQYLLDALYYDSDLERVNILSEIKEVIVFTKIPKNSIKIPVAGGESYSPDFAYVVKWGNGEQRLNFIVETKNYPGEDYLRKPELAKIRHAEKLFGGEVSVQFKTQFSNNKMVDLIKEAIAEKPEAK